MIIARGVGQAVSVWDASMQLGVKRDAEGLTKLLSFNAIATVIRLVFFSTQAPSLMERLEARTSEKTALGTVVCLGGVFAAVLKLLPYRGPFCRMSQATALVSLVTHLALAVVVKRPGRAWIGAAADAVSLYKVIRQKWLYLEREFTQVLVGGEVKFRVLWEVPMMEEERQLKCVICWDEKEEERCVPQMEKCCEECTAELFQTKIQAFEVRACLFSGVGNVAVVSSGALPRCPVARTELRLLQCLLFVWVGKWKQADIQYVRD